MEEVEDQHLLVDERSAWCIGKKRTLENSDFPPLLERDKPSRIVSQTEEVLRPILKEIEERSKEKKPSILKQLLSKVHITTVSIWMWIAIFRVHWPTLLPPMLFKFLGDMGDFVPILAMKYLLQSISLEEESGDLDMWFNVRKGYVYSVILFFSYFFVSLLLNQHHSMVIRAGLLIKYSLINLIFRKSISASTKGIEQVGGSGRVTTLVSNDTSAVELAIQYGNYVWAAPIQVIITIILLFREIQWAALGGVITTIIILAIQAKLGKIISKWQKETLAYTDARVSLITQILIGIRVWKVNSWEKEFGKKVESIRKQELSVIRKISFMNALSFIFVGIGPILITLIVFLLFGFLSDHELTVSKAFTTLSLLNLLRSPLRILPKSFTIVLNSLVSLDRISEIFFVPDMKSLPLEAANAPLVAIEILGTYEWCNGDDEDTLQSSVEETDSLVELDELGPENCSWRLEDVDVKVGTGDLVFVIGKVGTGKSTLVHTIFGETESVGEGFVHLHGNSISFCPQQAWIFNATVKNNILFNLPFQESRYNEVLASCALLPDLDLLPFGDQTEIGEFGINLSGGQQARISIARAVYAESDICIFDDIFSALDMHVAKHIMEKCILGPLLTDRTCLLVTHKLEFIKHADWVIGLGESAGEEGVSSRIIIQGSPQEMASSEYFKVTETDSLNAILDSDPLEHESEQNKNIPSQPSEPTAITSSKIISEEEKAVGAVKLSVVISYCKAIGLLTSACILATLLLQIVSNLVLYWWLSVWSVDEYGKGVYFYLGYYSLISGVSILSVFIFQTLIAVGGYRASKYFHENSLFRLLAAPIRFFDATPIGRILNRFSQDINIADYTVTPNMMQLLIRVGGMIGVLVLLCLLLPWLMFFFIPLSIIFLYLQQFYSSSSREMRRLDKISKSPIFAYFSESLAGLTTIRAYQQHEIFFARMNCLIECNQTIVWVNNQINRWLGVRMETLGGAATSVVAFFGVFFSSSLGSGIVGLLISQALSLSSAMNWTLRVVVEVESNLTSIERLLYYIHDIPQETIKGTVTPPPSWPEQGQIECKGLCLRYKEDLPFVLENFDLYIEANEKVGICGRTGAGKSSLIIALFRIVEASAGTIYIDGIDISTIDLDILRKKLSIIPQTPMLFPGSIRNNLDPFDEYSDDVLWDALEKVQMKSFVSNSEFKLETRIISCGDNFSAGQRQLLCLARAIIKNSKILILDEATASVDPETDQLIQETIRAVFGDCTVITIAHRLSSILHNDRVAVLDKGRVLEYDTPTSLRMDQNSAFSQLLHSGL